MQQLAGLHYTGRASLCRCEGVTHFARLLHKFASNQTQVLNPDKHVFLNTMVSFLNGCRQDRPERAQQNVERNW